jgi:diguanylate cyclase (GGDEF)-like protein
LHSPTILALAIVLMGLMTVVMAAVWGMNRRVPGLGHWALAQGLGFLCAIEVASRGLLPEATSVVLAQGLLLCMAYMGLVGARAHVGHAPMSHWPAALAILAVLSVSVYFTKVRPDFAARFLVFSVASGVFFILMALSVARGSVREHPARHVLAAACGLHGTFLVARPWLFSFGSQGPMSLEQVSAVAAPILMESVVALNVIALCLLLLVAEYTNGELRRLVDRDALTGVLSRRAFLERFQLESERPGRLALPLLVIDLDHFKRINDTWGHGCGDEALRHFVAIASRCLRVHDTMGRLGGEEFVVMLPRTTHEQACSVAERLRALLEQAPLQRLQGRVSLTASIGVTLHLPDEPGEAALSRADQAMYLAKSQGRNRVASLLQPSTASAATSAVVSPMRVA